MIQRMKENGCPSGRTPRFLQPCILLLLYQKKSYGYELVESIKRHGLVETNPDPGIIYKILKKNEKDGLVVSQWLEKERGAAQRIYKLTKSGEKALTEWADSIQIKVITLNNFLRMYQDVFRIGRKK